eukprot:1307308-Amphidinium_carterae.1
MGEFKLFPLYVWNAALNMCSVRRHILIQGAVSEAVPSAWMWSGRCSLTRFLGAHSSKCG